MIMDQNLPQSSDNVVTNPQSSMPTTDDNVAAAAPPKPALNDDMIQAQQDLAAAAIGQTPTIEPVTPPPLPPQPISGPKEQREVGAVAPEPELAPLVEQKEPEPEAEVKDWLEKLEEGEKVQLPQPVTDDYGQTLVEAAGATKGKIILPLDEEELQQGLHQKAINSIRWLAEWCLRIMKMAAGRVFYKSSD